jgi:hypothetical protein
MREWRSSERRLTEVKSQGSLLLLGKGGLVEIMTIAMNWNCKEVEDESRKAERIGFFVAQFSVRRHPDASVLLVSRWYLP